MAKSDKKRVTVVLSDPQEKKAVVRYDASADDAAISNAYITKVALKKLGNPSSVRITIEAVEDDE